MKQVVLTGVKPTGMPHIGNYLGAIRPAIESANKGSQPFVFDNTDAASFFFIADYHALTTVKCAKELRRLTQEIACVWLACGLDPKKTVFYRQSDVPEIFELSVILGNYTAKGLLDRAHAFKDACQAGRDVNIGLYTYPVLMSADILAFGTNFVPAGKDQQQHIEIAQDIAQAFNAACGLQVLVVPMPRIAKDVAIIPGLDGRKMSKSYGNVIPLFCDEAELLRCIKRITTDSSAPDAPKPKDHLIFQLYKHFSGKDMDTRIGWGDAKQKLFEVINAALKPMRDKYNYYMENYGEVEKILTEGAARARVAARGTLERVRKAIGV